MTDDHDGSAGHGAVAFLELTIAGQTIRLQLNQPQSVHGKTLLLLRCAGISFLLIDGIARAVLWFDGREATLSPLLTYAQIQTNLIQPPNDRPDLLARDRGHVTFFDEIGILLDQSLGASEVSAGLYSRFGKINPQVPPKWQRVIRLGGPFMVVDGAMRAERAAAWETSVIPLANYALASLARQPLWQNVVVGDLSEELLRRLRLVE